jgi:hypothetical protein
MKHHNCDFTLKGEQEVSSVISDKLQQHNPFSLIRLGDGEGLLLSISDQSTETDLNYMERHLGTAGVDLDVLTHLRNRLIKSIKGADVIGVRDDIVNVNFEHDNFTLPDNEFLESFRARFKLREVETTLDYLGSRRIAFLHKNLGSLDLNEKIQYCSAWFHYDYHNSGEIFKVLKQQDRIGVISCRPQLPGLLKELFGTSVNFHEIPGMYQDISGGKVVPGYTEELENTLNQQLVEFPGMLFLVGGGLYGKLYCQLIKDQGGIALDLGSLFDAWLGIPSRPTVYKAMYDAMTTETAVPAELLLTKENVENLT